MSTAPILVVEHEAQCPPGWLGEWLAEAGADLDVRRPYAGDDAACRPVRGTRAWWCSAVRWAPTTTPTSRGWPRSRRWCGRRSPTGTPVLGVCLGPPARRRRARRRGGAQPAGPADRRARRRLDRRREHDRLFGGPRRARQRRPRRAVEQRPGDPAAGRRRRPGAHRPRRAAGGPVRAGGVGRAVAPRGGRGDHPALGRPRPRRRGGARRGRRRLRRRRRGRAGPAAGDLAAAGRPVRRRVRAPDRRGGDGAR